MFQLDIKSPIFNVLSEVWTFFIKTPQETSSNARLSHSLMCLISVSFDRFLLSRDISFFLSTVSFLLPLPSLA